MIILINVNILANFLLQSIVIVTGVVIIDKWNLCIDCCGLSHRPSQIKWLIFALWIIKCTPMVQSRIQLNACHVTEVLIRVNASGFQAARSRFTKHGVLLIIINIIVVIILVSVRLV